MINARLAGFVLFILICVSAISAYTLDSACCGSATDSGAVSGGQAQSRQATSGPASEAPKTGQLKHIDIGSDSGTGGGNDQDLLRTWESYDENTGLPNIVPSDSEGELE